MYTWMLDSRKANISGTDITLMAFAGSFPINAMRSVSSRLRTP
jgi:hypothetical protein